MLSKAIEEYRSVWPRPGRAPRTPASLATVQLIQAKDARRNPGRTGKLKPLLRIETPTPWRTWCRIRRRTPGPQLLAIELLQTLLEMVQLLLCLLHPIDCFLLLLLNVIEDLCHGEINGHLGRHS